MFWLFSICNLKYFCVWLFACIYESSIVKLNRFCAYNNVELSVHIYNEQSEYNFLVFPLCFNCPLIDFNFPLSIKFDSLNSDRLDRLLR